MNTSNDNRMAARSIWLIRSMAFITVWLLTTPVSGMAATTLRVCADPDNLPYSNQKLEGFENKIAALLAKDMHMTVAYTWLKQRQGFFRQTLNADRCDVVISVPAGLEMVLTTRPYYCSRYMLVTQKQRNLQINSYNDPVLQSLKIGLHAIGNDGSNSPPAVALGDHGLASNIYGFSMWGNHDDKDPQSQVIDAVADGRVDAAIVWGPFAGFFAKRYGDQLQLVPAPIDEKKPLIAFAYNISMGVRKNDAEFASKLEKSIQRQSKNIRKVLLSYRVPLTESDSCSPVAAADE